MSPSSELLCGSMTVREIRQRYAQTAPLLESFGLPEACGDCPIEVVARKQGLRPEEALDALNVLVFGRTSALEEVDREAAEREEKFWSLV